MEINVSKIRYRRRKNQAVHNTIIFRSTCLMQLLCLVVNANLQNNNLGDSKIMRREVEVRSDIRKQEERLMEEDGNLDKIKNRIG